VDLLAGPLHLFERVIRQPAEERNCRVLAQLFPVGIGQFAPDGLASFRLEAGLN